MSQITSTAGGSGLYVYGAVNGNVTLFTTPNVVNAIFIVTLIVSSSNTLDNALSTPIKLTYGPNTPCIIKDNIAAAAEHCQWSWVQMVIS